jgi:hypothetical protein
MELSELELLVANHPQANEAQDVLEPRGWDEKAYDRQRKNNKRASEREIYIPPPKNIELRNRCLNDFQLLLKTYFPETYDEEFTEDRTDMLNSIVWAAMYGGDKAIAGPRGEGKTTLAIDSGMCLMLKNLCDFPVVIGKNQDSASDELKALREKMSASERFIEDFPEIGVPMDLAGPGAATPKQTVCGKYIRLFMGVKYFAFPTITKSQLPHWPAHVEPVSRGQVMGALGISGRIRGEKFRGKRPTLAIIDDLEDTQAANSDMLIEKNEKKIEEDIGGLGRSAKRIPRVMLCTTQNRKCIAYRYTDSRQKPSWNGVRYRKMKKPPDRMDLVDQYIEMRQLRKQDDPDAREAFRFWRDNKEVIEAGCVVSNKQSYSKDMHFDGEPVELSAIQAYYNRVADFGQKAVSTEIDNDPPETVGPQGQGVTAELVVSRLSGFARRQLPANTIALTAAIDLGKYRCHWTVVAWWTGGGGCVVDYGVAEVTGTDKAVDNEASEPMIYRALLNWRDELMSKNYVDATGVNRRIDFCLIDSGTFTTAAYEFCRQAGGVFHPSKGINPYHPRKQSSATCLASANLHAQKFAHENLWLYELDTNHWKQFVHERFLTPPMDENNMLRRGSLSLFELDGYEKHGSYAQHIAAEELLTEFKEGKGVKTYWSVKNENNHWLDATYMAAAASEVCGIKLIGGPEVSVEARHVDIDKPKPRKQANPRQHGNSRFRSRPGGWVPKRR